MILIENYERPLALAAEQLPSAEVFIRTPGGWPEDRESRGKPLTQEVLSRSYAYIGALRKELNLPLPPTLEVAVSRVEGRPPSAFYLPDQVGHASFKSPTILLNPVPLERAGLARDALLPALNFLLLRECAPAIDACLDFEPGHRAAYSLRDSFGKALLATLPKPGPEQEFELALNRWLHQTFLSGLAINLAVNFRAVSNDTLNLADRLDRFSAGYAFAYRSTLSQELSRTTEHNAALRLRERLDLIQAVALGEELYTLHENRTNSSIVAYLRAPITTARRALAQQPSPSNDPNFDLALKAAAREGITLGCSYNLVPKSATTKKYGTA